MSLTLSLYSEVHRKTDQNFICSRMGKALHALGKKQGYAKAAGIGSGLAVLGAFTGGITYFCLEGVVRSFLEIIHEEDPIVRYRPLGDIGGWSIIPIFSILAFISVLKKAVGEGEYVRVKSICLDWIKKNRIQIDSDNQFKSELYNKVNALLDLFGKKGLFYKGLSSRRLIALEIMREAKMDQSSEIHKADSFLQGYLETIQGLVEEVSLYRKFYDGFVSIKQWGCSERLLFAIKGVALPILFFLSAITSFVGEFALGKELFVDKNALTDTGHFGEWPFNAIEAAAALYYALVWIILNEGALMRTQKAYAIGLEQLKGNAEFHNRLCHHANQAMDEISGSWNDSRFPFEFHFESLEEGKLIGN